jgi:undecaprenyl-diphosphatase
VVVYFWRDVAAMLAAAPGALTGRGGRTERLVRLIVVGTVPIVAVALLFGDGLETLRSPAVVATTLVIGAIGLLIAEAVGAKTRDEQTVGYGLAVAIGCAQALALIPGISRSGATLTVAMLAGLSRASAARFVFLLSLPAVLAAAAKELIDVAEIGVAGLPVTLFVIGLVVSGVVGYLTIKYFLRYLANHSLAVFAYYRFALAAVTLVWLVTR